MRGMELDDRIDATIPGRILGSAELLDRCAFLSRAGPDEEPTYHVSYLEYPGDGEGREVALRYSVDHADEAGARFDFAAFFYPLMRPRHESGLSRTLGEESRLPLPGPPKQLQAARTLALKRSRFALP